MPSVNLRNKGATAMWSSWADGQFTVLLVVIASLVGTILSVPVVAGARLARIEREIQEMARKIDRLVEALAPQPKEGTLIYEKSAD
jgi:hypothetical protein